MKQTIVISDIHGCLAETKQLLDLCNYDPSIDHVISVGDLVDRGPDPLGCIHFMQQINATVVLGNHEDKYLRFWKHEQLKTKQPSYKNPMHLPERKIAFYNTLSNADFIYLNSLPPYYSITNTIKVIHAGLEPIDFYTQPKNNYVYLRYIRQDGEKYIGTVHGDEKLKLWADLWNGPESIIYGHYVHDFKEPRLVTKPFGWVIGIDTGGCFGGHLTALVFTEEDLKESRLGKIKQVKCPEYMAFNHGMNISDR